MTFETHSGDGCEQLTLNRPPMNALDLDAVVALGDWFDAYASEPPLVLSGDGRAFSAGVDTDAFASYSPARVADFFAAITRMTCALCSIRAPVVAAVNGHAIGGGLVLALCADYRIAASPAEHKFGLTEAKAGVPFPDGPVEIIRSELPTALLRSLTLSSRLVDADYLLAHGVFDETTAPEEVVERARAQAVALSAQPAFSEVKQQVRAPLVARLKALAN